MTLGSVPASMNIAANTMTGDFDFTAAAAPASGTVQAYVGTDTPVEASVNVIDPSSMQLSLTGWKLVQENKSKEQSLASAISIGVGEYLIVARDADQNDFQEHWGVTLDESVHFINGGNNFLIINGSLPTFAIYNADDQLVDGISTPMSSTGECYQRKVPVQAASEVASWTDVADSAGTPGSGQDPGNPASGLYISEICDSSGAGNFHFEYVELFFDGNP